MHATILSFFVAAAKADQGRVTLATFRMYLDNMFEAKLGVWIDG